MIEIDATLHDTFLKVLQDHTAGDPMDAAVKWTNLSRRQIAARMGESGTRAGRDVVSQLLRKHGYRKRKALKKRTMGHHRDRNAQFEKIARLKKKYVKAGLPVISIDASATVPAEPSTSSSFTVSYTGTLLTHPVVVSYTTSGTATRTTTRAVRAIRAAFIAG